MGKFVALIFMILAVASCGARKNVTENPGSEQTPSQTVDIPAFNADSAYRNVERQVEFGPRVPNSESHEKTAQWLVSELTRYGAQVTTQRAVLTAFDGTRLSATNIMGSFNPEMANRLLLLAHYDTRPWADEDADPANHSKPLDGANDGASGVGVLLEIARLIGERNPERGIDFLFVDAEDYGESSNEESWALGTRYFAQNPIRPGYKPSKAILLDMVGDRDAVFPAEYFSRQSAPELDDAIRRAAEVSGHGNRFPRVLGTAVTDDHVELINAGIPAIDIIDYRVGSGFAPSWHTMGDNMERIDRETLRAVGETLIHYIYTL